MQINKQLQFHSTNKEKKKKKKKGLIRDKTNGNWEVREYEMIIEKKKMERERERNNTCYNWAELLMREKLLRMQS